LALSKAAAPERALTAAKLVLGLVQLIEPRVTQAARLAHVSDPYVDAAVVVLRSGDMELIAAVAAGRVPLLEAAVLVKHSLFERYVNGSPATRAEFARSMGPARTWDEMIVPYL